MFGFGVQYKRNPTEPNTPHNPTRLEGSRRVPRGRRGNLEHGPTQGLEDQQAAAGFLQWLEVNSPHNHILYIGYPSIGHGIVMVLLTWFQDVRAIACRPCYIAKIWLATTPKAGCRSTERGADPA